MREGRRGSVHVRLHGHRSRIRWSLACRPQAAHHRLFDIPADDLVATTLSAQRIARATLSALGAEGVNLFNCSGVDAWQTVFHFHMHVIPRYRDRGRDRMELPFKPGRPADVEAIAERAMVLAAAL